MKTFLFVIFNAVMSGMNTFAIWAIWAKSQYNDTRFFPKGFTHLVPFLLIFLIIFGWNIKKFYKQNSDRRKLIFRIMTITIFLFFFGLAALF